MTEEQINHKDWNGPTTKEAIDKWYEERARISEQLEKIGTKLLAESGRTDTATKEHIKKAINESEAALRRILQTCEW